MNVEVDFLLKTIGEQTVQIKLFSMELDKALAELERLKGTQCDDGKCEK